MTNNQMAAGVLVVVVGILFSVLTLGALWNWDVDEFVESTTPTKIEYVEGDYYIVTNGEVFGIANKKNPDWVSDRVFETKERVIRIVSGLNRDIIDAERRSKLKWTEEVK